MPGTTPFGLPIPLDADPFVDNTLAIRNLANKIDTLIKRKSVDEVRISTTVLAADNELTFPAAAGKVYEGELFLVFATVNSAIDARVGFTFPAGVMSFGATAMDPAVASGVIGSGSWAAFSAAVSGVSYCPAGIAAGETIVRVSFTYACTTAGTVRLVWCQNTSTASNLTLKTGSKMKVQVL